MLLKNLTYLMYLKFLMNHSNLMLLSFLMLLRNQKYLMFLMFLMNH